MRAHRIEGLGLYVQMSQWHAVLREDRLHGTHHMTTMCGLRRRHASRFERSDEMPEKLCSLCQAALVSKVSKLLAA